MNYEVYEELFKAKANNEGYSQENIFRCLEYAKPLLEKNLPVIYNSSHLASLVGYKRSYLKRAIFFTEFFYRKFYVKKRNGKQREINEPLPSLKEIQYWILENILYNIDVSRFAKAYIPGKTLVENLKFHKNQPLVLCVDVENFFASIKESKVVEIFLTMGYSVRVANTLAKLCCLKGEIPQGAPTSPQLSNIFMVGFDKIISSYCVKKNIRYTRYADDLTFSGDFNTNEILALLKSELDELDLVFNEEKTKLMTKSMRQVVTGVVVNKKIQVPKEKRREIRRNIYYIRKFGLANHLMKIDCKKSNYLKHLLGQVNYVLFINPQDKEALSQKEFLLGLLE